MNKAIREYGSSSLTPSLSVCSAKIIRLWTLNTPMNSVVLQKSTLAELNKPADIDNPQTGYNSDMLLLSALLFIIGAAVITLTVVDRKRRMTSEKK